MFPQNRYEKKKSVQVLKPWDFCKNWAILSKSGWSWGKIAKVPESLKKVMEIGKRLFSSLDK